jgi:murein DD-endopeptidase MepM/ murein hydrolase activator NlpD
MSLYRRLCPLLLFCVLLLVASFPAGAAPDVPPATAVHVVVAGETLSGIAEKYGVSLSSLLEANSITDPDQLSVGQQLLVPGVMPAVPAPRPASKGASQAETLSEGFTGLHVVAAGDSLTRIAARYKTTAVELARVNGLADANHLIVGQRLLVPGDATMNSRTGVQPQELLEPFVRIETRPDHPKQGDTVLVTVETSEDAVLTGSYEGREVRFLSSGRQHWGLVPVHPMADVGPYDLKIVARVPNKQPATTVWPLWVKAGNFEVEDITLPADRQKLLNRDLIVAENARLAKALSQTDSVPLWRGLFELPLTNPVVSSAFGARRSYNRGPVSSYHEGFDFDAHAGDPVTAAADGQVVMAETLTVRGNAILIDHGLGVHTGYWHLSEIDVKPGQQVKAGETIGKVGGSGLATGPHLHWELRVEDVNVNPEQWTEQTFP